MFGNKNSAVPYVRIGGVDRQSVLTSNANGNTPVKEIGVDANGNLVFSTDLATFKSVLDLKYSQFKSNDENQDDTWETEKSVSMRASGTLEDGTTKDTGVIVSKEYVAMVNASMKDDTSTATQISVSNNDATIYSTNGTSTTQITVTPTGAKVNDKEIATTDKLPNLDNYLDLTKETAQRVSGQIIFLSDYIYFNRGVSDGMGNNIASKLANHMTFGDPDFTSRILGKTVRPKYATTYGTSSSDLKDLALLSDVPSVKQSTGTSTTATMSQNAITSAIPTKTSQLTNDSGFINKDVSNLTNYLPLTGGTLTGNVTLTVGNSIVDSNGKELIAPKSSGVIIGDPTSLISLKGSQVRPFYTSSGGNGTQSLALYADIPDISGKANLSGGNTFSGTQTFNNDVNINGTGKCRSKVLVTYNLGSALVKIRSWGMGRIDYLLGDGKTLRHEFGQAWINDGVTFTNAYSTVLWCTATPDCSNDSQIQGFSINSCSTTKMTFKGGADQLARWEVWGIIG